MSRQEDCGFRPKADALPTLAEQRCSVAVGAELRIPQRRNGPLAQEVCYGDQVSRTFPHADSER
jgi:hypothetical protein